MGVLPVILCIGKRQLAMAALFCCFFLGLAAVLWQGNQPAETAVFAPRDGVPVTVVIDPAERTAALCHPPAWRRALSIWRCPPD